MRLPRNAPVSRWPLALGAALLLIACSEVETGPGPVGSVTGATIELTSPAFDQGSAIARRPTCDGDDKPPPLSWSGVPANAKSLALVVDDPDARGTWVHWVVYHIPAGLSGFSETALSSGVTSIEGVTEGRNDFNKTGYGGPCPPDGPAHRYIFRLFAVDSAFKLASGATKSELLAAMEGKVVAQGSLMGTYKRQQ